MAVQTVPTKGNLMNTKKSLALAKNGYELLDRKRNILIREMMTLIDHANAIQQKIDDAYAEAYTALQTANVTNGFCEDISNAIPYENGLKLDSRSVMGVEIPILTIEEREDHHYLHYGLRTTNSAIDKVYTKFTEVKNLTVELAEIENSVYRLATSGTPTWTAPWMCSESAICPSRPAARRTPKNALSCMSRSLICTAAACCPSLRPSSGSRASACGCMASIAPPC